MFNLDLLFVRMYSELDPLSNIVRIMDKKTLVLKRVYKFIQMNQLTSLVTFLMWMFVKYLK